MKFCPHCHRWNPGQPQRCRYCGRTWAVRICTAGHINPADAQFCGECGRPNMSEPAGPMPLILRLFTIVKVITIVFLVLLVVAGLGSSVRNTNWSSLAVLAIPLTLLWLALRYASSSLKFDILGSLLRLLGKVLSRR